MTRDAQVSRHRRSRLPGLSSGGGSRRVLALPCFCPIRGGLILGGCTPVPSSVPATSPLPSRFGADARVYNFPACWFLSNGCSWFCVFVASGSGLGPAAPVGLSAASGAAGAGLDEARTSPVLPWPREAGAARGTPGVSPEKLPENRSRDGGSMGERGCEWGAQGRSPRGAMVCEGPQEAGGGVGGGPAQAACAKAPRCDPHPPPRGRLLEAASARRHSQDRHVSGRIRGGRVSWVAGSRRF